MRKSGAAIIALLIACKGDDKHAPTPPPSRPFGVVAEIRAKATLVPGTTRFAVSAGRGWYESPDLTDKPGVGAAIAAEIEVQGGVVDVFLGTTPIVVSGEEHRETAVRIAPARTPIPFDGLASKIESTRDGREVWAFTHELTKHVAFVTGTTVEQPPPFALIGPVAEAASPVSRRLCEVPAVQDIAVADRAIYALVVECNDEAPLRLVTFDGVKPTEMRLPSRRTLGIVADKLAASRSGQLALVGTRDGKLAIDRITAGTVKPATHGAIKRVFAAVIADDGAVWTFVLDDAAKPAILRDGAPIDVGEGRTAITLAYDSTLGVVVLAAGTNATWILAEHPPATPTVITPPA